MEVPLKQEDGVSIPAQVLERGENADRMLAEINEVPPVVPGQPVAPVVDTGTPALAVVPPAPGVPAPAVPAPVVVPPPASLEEQIRLVTEQYRTLQGKYNKEVQQVATDNMRLRTRETELSHLVSNLNAQVTELTGKVTELGTTATPSGNSAVDGLLNGLSDTDRQVLEDEGLSNPALLSVLQKLGAVGSQTTSPAVEDTTQAEGAFWIALDSNVFNPATGQPDHAQINADPRWVNWLTLPSVNPAHGGRIRQAVVNDAQASLYAQPIADLFNEFKLEHGLLNVQGQAPPLPPAPPYVPPAVPQPQQNIDPRFQSNDWTPGAEMFPPQPDLNQHIEPGPGQGSVPLATPGAQQGRIYRTSEITSHYALIARNPTCMSNEQKNLIEADMFRAREEGRIVKG